MLYLTALIIFFALHAIPFSTSARTKIIELTGDTTYKLLFSLISLLAIALGVWAWDDFPTIYFYEPAVFLKQLHLLIMFFAVYLWIAAEVPNNIKRVVKHPMLMGVNLWAFGHLLANGDLRSMLLFLSFLLYAIIAIILSNYRADQGAESSKYQAAPLRYDAGVLAASILTYGVIVYFHDNLFGVAVLPYFASH